MKVQKIKLSSYDVTWIVLDDNHLPIKPITEFVRYLNNVDKSPCTVKSYAYCLKLFWDYLADKQLNWKTINLASLAGFVGWLRQSKKPAQIIDLLEIQAARKPATINVILGCLSSFYRFHNQLGNTDVKVTEYVFINLTTYEALNYSVAKKLFITLRRKCNLYVRPHMLRHSHASDLLKSGWEMSLIQKRLGHASIQTTIDIYTHIDTKQMKQAFKQFLSNKEKN